MYCLAGVINDDDDNDRKNMHFQQKSRRIWVPFYIAQKPSTLDDLEESLRTPLCQSCGIAAKRYDVEGVGDGTLRYGDADFLQSADNNYVSLQWFGCNFERTVVCLQPSPMCAKLP